MTKRRPPKKGDFEVDWLDSGREPQSPPNPNYPRGIDVDNSRSDVPGPRCRKKLPYPAQRCGMYYIKCRTCGQTAAITTAGRRDDPRSVTLDCMKAAH